MKPMKIKRYMRWKRNEAFRQADLLETQKRVARAKAFFEDAIEKHILKQSRITNEQVYYSTFVILETPEFGSIEIVSNNQTSAKIIDDLDCLDDEQFKSSLSKMLLNEYPVPESSFLCQQINLPQTFVRARKFAYEKSPLLMPNLLS